MKTAPTVRRPNSNYKQFKAGDFVKITDLKFGVTEEIKQMVFEVLEVVDGMVTVSQGGARFNNFFLSHASDREALEYRLTHGKS